MTNKTTRPATICLRVTAEEKKALEDNAACERRTLSAYLSLLFEKAIAGAVATAKRRVSRST